MRTSIALWAVVAFAIGEAAYAQSTSQPSASASTPATAPVAAAPTTAPTTAPTAAATQPGEPGGAEELGTVHVRSYMDVQREEIAPPLGAVVHTMGPEQIENVPGGENATFRDVLLENPGVVEDSFGQVHVRGEHANLTYRVNGILLPQPLNGFGQELDTRLIDSVSLIDGTLPAQFGFHTAGIIDVQTKSGDTLAHNELSLYGGMYDTIEPSVQLGGTIGKLDYFIAASYNHNDLGIENPASTHRALHDYTAQEKAFGYFSYHLDDTSRLSLLMNASYSDFQIPNTANLPPMFTLAGHPAGNSADINENQNEQVYYTVLSYQKTTGNLSFQVSGFTNYGQITFNPDPTRDLIFQGVASGVYNSFLTHGIQFDSSYIANDQHTIRAGFLADYTIEKLDTNTLVFPVDPMTGAQSSSAPLDIDDNSSNRALEAGGYVQDEWRLNSQWTLNYGLRLDTFDANYDDESQLSPRANVVWKIDSTTTAHAGYARYFVPPPVSDVPLSAIKKFADTTNAPTNFEDGAPKVERSNTYDAGISRQITKPWQVDFDGFYKQAENLVDLGQFGDAIILSPFNYRHGTVYGAEWSNTYKEGGFSGFGNFSWVVTQAHDIDSQQFQIDSAELAYIQDHNIHLDHEGEFTISAGAAYTWKNDRVFADLEYGSGLRGGFANTHQLSQYIPVSLGYEHVFHPNGLGAHAIKFRVDVINLFDEAYQLRSGSGIGIGAPQWGQRRTVLAGLTYEF